jgi:hypothetical protein
LYSDNNNKIIEIMKTITLNHDRIFEKGQTTKYWRDIKCSPQTVELKKWSSNHPLFYLKGIVVNSHDEREIGTNIDVCVQTYDFWLENNIKEGIYTINQ